MEKPGTPADTPHPHPNSAARRPPKRRNRHLRMSVGGSRLKRRGRGRPGRGAEPAQVVAVRLTTEELAALDAAAQRHHLSRSEAIRAALAHYAA